MSWFSFVAEACLTGLVVDACVCLSALTENQPARLDSDLVWQFYGTRQKLWMYILYSPLISHQLTTHKRRIITFWFSFSSCLCIKFSPIFLFLLEVSCSYISTVGQACSWWVPAHGDHECFTEMIICILRKKNPSKHCNSQTQIENPTFTVIN